MTLPAIFINATYTIYYMTIQKEFIIEHNIGTLIINATRDNWNPTNSVNKTLEYIDYGSFFFSIVIYTLHLHVNKKNHFYDSNNSRLQKNSWLSTYLTISSKSH